jgi:antitoxin component YwqK of YwqJK toxin-antitoxin module
MLWSSYKDGQYMQTVAYSQSGKLQGPWEQYEPIVGDDSGHGMIFQTFDGKLMLVLHQPFRMPLARAKIYEVEDAGDTLRVVRERNDLHGKEREQ